MCLHSKIKLLFVVALGTFALLLAPLAFAGSNWSGPLVLGTGTLYPAVAIDSLGTQYFVWVTAAGSLQYRTCGGIVAGCTPTTTIATVGAAFFPGIALDPQGRPNLVWDSRVSGTDDYEIFWTRRSGDSWLYPQQLSRGFHSEAPDIAIGARGIIHIVYQTKDTAGKTGFINYIESSDGEHFTTAQQLDPAVSGSTVLSPTQTLTGTFASGFYPRVAVDSQDHAQVVWNAATAPYGIRYRYQTPGGWSNEVDVGSGHKDQTPDIAVAPNNLVGIVWSHYDDFDSEFATYDEGKLVARLDPIDTGLAQSLRPRVAADCVGNFHFVFQGSVNADSHWNIYHRVYNPGTATLNGRDPIAVLTGKQEQTPFVAATPYLGVTDLAAIVYTDSTDNLVSSAYSNLGIACSRSGSATAVPSPTATATLLPALTEKLQHSP